MYYPIYERLVLVGRLPAPLHDCVREPFFQEATDCPWKNLHPSSCPSTDASLLALHSYVASLLEIQLCEMRNADAPLVASPLSLVYDSQKCVSLSFFLSVYLLQERGTVASVRGKRGWIVFGLFARAWIDNAVFCGRLLMDQVHVQDHDVSLYAYACARWYVSLYLLGRTKVSKATSMGHRVPADVKVTRYMQDGNKRVWWF